MASNLLKSDESQSVKSQSGSSKAAAEESESQASGKSLLDGNGFKVIKKIGSGSYSKVKLAYSESHKTMVAIKIVSKKHVPDEFLKKFLYNEIRVVKFLKHENIIKYYQSIESSHRLYVIMQFAENGSILDLIHKERRLSEVKACKLFKQIIAAVEFCHSQGVCHRDIKCENILLDDKFNVKLIDFGFARHYKQVQRSSAGADSTAAGSSNSTRSSTASHRLSLLGRKEKDESLSKTYCGSFAYASPEVLKGVPYNPFMSDIWAMGCVLYAMVFGRLPFDDREPAKLLKQVQLPLAFPNSIQASESCKACLRKILAPLKTRYTMETLKNDHWMNSPHLDTSLSAPNRPSSAPSSNRSSR